MRTRDRTTDGKDGLHEQSAAQPADQAQLTAKAKGKVERLHRTIGEGLIATLPHYSHGPRRRNGALYAQPAPLSLPQLQAKIRDFIDAYNRGHRHSSLAGMTPGQKWESSDAPLETIPAERLRWMLMADATRKVLKDGIHFGSEIFVAPALTSVGGETIQVRYMPHDLRSIEVFKHDDGWLCTAYPQDQLSPEDAAAVLEQRQEAAREMGRRKAAATRKARARAEPLTGDIAVADITVVTRRSRRDAERQPNDKRSNAVLRVLGLSDELNKPNDQQSGQDRRSKP